MKLIRIRFHRQIDRWGSPYNFTAVLSDGRDTEYVTCKAAELLSRAAFRRACLAQAGIIPEIVETPTQWNELIRRLLEECRDLMKEGVA